MDNKLNSTIAFFSGDIMATMAYTYYTFGAIDWIHPILKIALAFFVGVVGGFGGLLGKKLFEWFEKKLK